MRKIAVACLALFLLGVSTAWAQENEPEKEKVQQKKEKGEPRTKFIRALLIDGVAGYENGTRKMAPGIGLHMAFLKTGRVYIGAMGVMFARVTDVGMEASVIGRSQMVQRTGVVPFLTQTVSVKLRETEFGDVFISLTGIHRVIPTAQAGNSWDPAVSLSIKLK